MFPKVIKYQKVFFKKMNNYQTGSIKNQHHKNFGKKTFAGRAERNYKLQHIKLKERKT